MGALTQQRGRGWSDEAADFVEFAAANQAAAVRAAVVVTGSGLLGEQVARSALAEVASHWDAARDEGPAGWLRRASYRRALTAAREQDGRPDVPPEGPVASEADDDEAAVVRATRAALAAMPARQRAVLALCLLDDRVPGEAADVAGTTVDQATADLRAGARLLRDAAAALPGGTGWEADERALLEAVADLVPEPALAEAAWAQARARRRTVRRRGLLVAAAAMAGTATVALAARGEQPGSRPSPRPTVAASGGRLARVSVDGGTVVLAPDPARLDLLPAPPGALDVALPEGIWPDPTRPLDRLPSSGLAASVRVVYLVRSAPERFIPALFVPRVSSRALAVPWVVLEATRPGTDEPLPLGPHTIDAGRHRVVLAQPGAVVVLDVPSGAARSIRVPDDGLLRTGWAADGRTVVATSRRTTWLVDTGTEEVRRVGRGAGPGWSDISTEAGRPFIRTLSGDGRVIGVQSMIGPDLVLDGPVASAPTGGWVCRAASFAPLAAAGDRGRGLVATRAGVDPVVHLLAFGAQERFRPLAWPTGGLVLVEVRSVESGRTVVRVLAWVVALDRLFLVARGEVPARDPGTDGAFTPTWAI